MKVQSFPIFTGILKQKYTHTIELLVYEWKKKFVNSSNK